MDSADQVSNVLIGTDTRRFNHIIDNTIIDHLLTHIFTVGACKHDGRNIGSNHIRQGFAIGGIGQIEINDGNGKTPWIFRNQLVNFLTTGSNRSLTCVFFLNHRLAHASQSAIVFNDQEFKHLMS